MSVEFEISDQLFFEMLKLEIRGKTIRFASKRKHATREQEREIEKHIENAKQKLDCQKSIALIAHARELNII